MSKKLIAILFGIMLCLCLAFYACGETPDDTDITGGNGDETGYEQIGGGEQTENPDEDNTDREQPDNTDSENKVITEMYITVNDFKLKVTLEQNSSVEALIEILKQGDIVYTAYGNSFEIYGDIGHTLPTNNTHITSQPGDVLLWAGSNICIFFGNNSYSYTRIGKIDGYTTELLKTMLGTNGSVQVKISLK